MALVKISELTAAGTLDGSELVEIVQGGANKKATVAQLAAEVEGLGQFIQTVGDGTNVDIVVTHNLNTRNLHVSVRRATSPFDEIMVNNDATTVNTLTLHFGSVPPGLNSMVVTVSK